jgi:hypothetical protein
VKRRNRSRHKDPSPLLSVYFIGVGDHLFIKIGFSEDVEKELKNIQERNPSYPLTLLGYIPGDERLGKEIFEKFNRLQLGMGWFERSLEMEKFLDLFEEDSTPSGEGDVRG